MLKTEEQFRSEIANAEKLLSDRGKAGRVKVNNADAGIKCDFELPYSSFPVLLGRNKFQSENNA